MTTDEIKRWQDEHGGPGGDPETDANGITTHRAADGSFIAIRPNGTLAMRGHAPEPATAQAAFTGTPAAEPTWAATGGMGMDQQALLALLAQIAPGGDTSRLEFSQGVTKKTQRAITGQDEEVQTPYVQWIDRATGRTIIADVGEGGNSYAVTFNGTKPENKKEGATPASTTTTIEGTQVGTDANGQPVWDNEQPREVVRDQTGRVISSKPLVGTALQDWRESRERSRNPGGKTDAEIEKDQKEQEGRQRQDDTTIADVSYSGTGKNRQKVTTYKSGRKVTEAAPTNATAVSTSYDPRTGKKTVTYDDGTTSTEEQKPDAASLGGPVPRNAPRYTPTAAGPTGDWGIVEYNEQLREAERLGVITRAQALQLLEAAGKAADVARNDAVTRQNQAATARNQDITQRSQDVGEVQSRRSSAGSGFDNLFSDFNTNARYLGRGGGDIAARAFMEALGARDATIARAGGYADVPRIGAADPTVAPYLQAVRSTQIVADPDGNIAISPPGAVPPGTLPPNAIGAGSIGNQPAPGAAPPMRDDWSTRPGGRVNPAAGEPGNDPTQPVGMVPAYLGGPTQPPAAWDPEPTVARLREQGLTDDEIQEALAMSEQEWAA